MAVFRKITPNAYLLQNSALGANSGDRSSAAPKSSPTSVAAGSSGGGNNVSATAASNNTGGGGGGGHRGGGKGSRYVPPHLRSGKGGGSGFDDDGEDQGRGGYDQDRGIVIEVVGQSEDHALFPIFLHRKGS